MPSQYKELARFINEHAVMRGSFTLASGRQSSYYIDAKQILSRPQGLRLICQAMREELANYPVASIGGLEIGAIYVATAVSLDSLEWPAPRKPIPLFTVRKQAKGHGAQKKVEGVLVKGQPVAVVDDVITTGGSILQAIEAVRQEGCEVAVALSIVDRLSGANEALKSVGVPYRPLLTITDLGLSNDPSSVEKAPQTAR